MLVVFGKHCVSLTASLPLQFGRVTRMGREARTSVPVCLTTTSAAEPDCETINLRWLTLSVPLHTGMLRAMVSVCVFQFLL